MIILRRAHAHAASQPVTGFTLPCRPHEMITTQRNIIIIKLYIVVTGIAQQKLLVLYYYVKNTFFVSHFHFYLYSRSLVSFRYRIGI